MRRGVRAAAWILLALAVLAVAVIVPVGALRAHGTEEFNRWVGLATVAAVPLAAGAFILMFWSKITVSVLSDKLGKYQVDSLPAGDYDVQIRAIGYRSEPQTGISLTAQQKGSARLQPRQSSRL